MQSEWAPMAWCDGQLAPVHAIAIPALSLSALYGIGLFETLRAYGGRPFALERHIGRLKLSAAELGLESPWLAETSRAVDGVAAVLTANGLRDAAIRITLFAEGTSLDDPRTALVISARRFEGYPPEWYRDGIRVVVAPWRRSSGELHTRLKSGNYMTCLLSRQWARSRGAEEALLLNVHGRVCEGSVSNVFAVIGGRLLTPPLSEGLLPGITRALVMELAKSEGLEVIEQPLGLADLTTADEVFLTNSLMGFLFG
ncbi:MAG: aminotransferase class IV [Armatimonadetes bacterium]|nr:aminotransferase class IV [Armatimonadota bacterium]